MLSALDFIGLAVVVHRPDYIADFGVGPVDTSLPAHACLMALDLLMERVVMALDHSWGGANAEVMAEARGSKEDALLQYEFSRLHLDGTSYIAPSWFRQQLRPGIRFEGKGSNVTGLQFADLLARPVGEKVMDPDGSPPRWSELRSKLCPRLETKHSILGLKVIPWRERYRNLWER